MRVQTALSKAERRWRSEPVRVVLIPLDLADVGDVASLPEDENLVDRCQYFVPGLVGVVST